MPGGRRPFRAYRPSSPHPGNGAVRGVGPSNGRDWSVTAERSTTPTPSAASDVVASSPDTCNAAIAALTSTQRHPRRPDLDADGCLCSPKSGTVEGALHPAATIEQRSIRLPRRPIPASRWPSRRHAVHPTSLRAREKTSPLGRSGPRRPHSGDIFACTRGSGPPAEPVARPDTAVQVLSGALVDCAPSVVTT